MIPDVQQRQGWVDEGYIVCQVSPGAHTSPVYSPRAG